MAPIQLGPVTSFKQSRYTITLGSGKRLVLFRLPRIESTSTCVALTNETDDGWAYYCMEAECPHAGGPMTKASIDIEDSSYVASCPWHSYDFNVETEAVGQLSIEPVSEKLKLKNMPTTNDTDDTNFNRLNPPAPGEIILLPETATLCEWCVHILNTTNPEHKIQLTHHLFSTFEAREHTPNPMSIGHGAVLAPDEPPRENLDSKVQPWATPRTGRGGSVKSRITMLHALANIEQWAIDLAIDIMVRFSTFRTIASSQGPAQELPRTFYYDWLKVANDEAKHFSLLRARLEELGSSFGALAVHHGLWESAAMTSHDLRARISIIALVHEARGLDVNPMTINKFQVAGDMASVDTLRIIHHDEITHVTTGHRWLSWICEQEGTDAVQVFRANVKQYFKGAVKGPFNEEARMQAGMDKSYYEDLNGAPWKPSMVAGG
ncbi:hypothetical protein MBLNU459_g8332t2 [Dothideomycetes sp. NU459]